MGERRAAREKWLPPRTVSRAAGPALSPAGPWEVQPNSPRKWQIFGLHYGNVILV